MEIYDRSQQLHIMAAKEIDLFEMEAQKTPVPLSAGLSQKHLQSSNPMHELRQKKSVPQSAMDFVGERFNELAPEKQMSHPVEKEEDDPHFEQFLANR